MKFNDTYVFFHQLRGLLLIIMLMCVLFFTIKCNAYVFDCELPSGEAIQAEKEHRNRENEKSYERCRERDQDKPRSENDDRSRDRERANTYLLENMAHK